MLSQSEINYLVSAAHSELKRWGGTEVTLTHLAALAARRWPKDYEQVFDEVERDRVIACLNSGDFVGTASDVTELLAHPDGVPGVIAGLHLGLADLLAKVEVPQPGEHSSGAESTGQERAPEEPWTPRGREFVQRVEPRSDLIGFDACAAELAAVVTRRQPLVPVVVGPAGGGRTSVFQGLAQVLADSGKPHDVWRVGPETLGQDPAFALRMIFAEAQKPVVLCIDDFERIAGLGFANRVNAAVLDQLSLNRDHPLVRVVVAVDQRYAARLDVYAEEYSAAAQRVTLPTLTKDQVQRVVSVEAEALANHHQVRIAPDLMASALLPGRSDDVLAHPGLAMARLDAACSRAAVAGADAATASHLGRSHEGGALASTAALVEQLSAKIKGQTEAIAAVTSRLSLTLANLDLRPNRPDGVFLFVGPTGVGKSELALALSESLFGPDQLIRLDMSEFAQEWGLSRIAGPMPGYVGSTEPEGWLTTKIAAKSRCVVLLDEIEKAHPQIWNIFLQAFDAGRLTDSRGVTVDMSKVVFIMTSNLGAIEAAKGGLGFSESARSQSATAERILSVVRDRMPPELVNRIDEVIVFNGLAPEVIAEIAEAEVTRVLERLAEGGWHVSLGEGVVAHLAETGYDAAYGARHLQRNIERLLLVEVARAGGRRLRVEVDAGRSGHLTVRDDGDQPPV